MKIIHLTEVAVAASYVVEEFLCRWKISIRLELLLQCHMLLKNSHADGKHPFGCGVACRWKIPIPIENIYSVEAVVARHMLWRILILIGNIHSAAVAVASLHAVEEVSYHWKISIWLRIVIAASHTIEEVSYRYKTSIWLRYTSHVMMAFGLHKRDCEREKASIWPNTSCLQHVHLLSSSWRPSSVTWEVFLNHFAKTKKNC